MVVLDFRSHEPCGNAAAQKDSVSGGVFAPCRRMTSRRPLSVFEEQVWGWLARIARATTLARQIAGYGELKHLLQDYCNLAVLEFDAKAAAEFERLKQAKIRVGDDGLEDRRHCSRQRCDPSDPQSLRLQQKFPI